MSGTPDWSIEGRDWPHRAYSSFVEAGGIRWHVQKKGGGPALLLVHGTGAATHSWRGLLPLLAARFTVIAPDLPGHGFSASPAESGAYSLPRVAQSLAALLDVMEIAPRVIVGHSAGAAIGVRMALDRPETIDTVIGINAALTPFPGLLGAWAGLLASALHRNPFASAAFAMQAGNMAAMRGLIAGTGSQIDAQGLDYYQRLFRKPAHIKATLGLMAHWDLAALRRDMQRLRAHLALLVAAADRAVPPDACEGLRDVVQRLSITRLEGLGHLAHEEDAGQVAERIEEIMFA